MHERINGDPNHIRIFDTTLRDGNQSPVPGKEGIFTFQDKMDIARNLAEIGVFAIEAGFPNSNPDDFEAVSEIAKRINGPVICGLSRTSPEDIDKTWEAIEPAKYTGGARIHIFISSSAIQMQHSIKMTPEMVVVAARDAVRRAKSYTDDVEFSPEDASRSDFTFMMRVILEAVDQGATTINIPDTVGFAQPAEYAKRIGSAKRIVDQHIGRNRVIFSAHGHNDLGLATANTLAAVMVGVRQVEVAVNGIGERAGNTSLEEIVENIRNRPDFFNRYGRPLFTGIDHESLLGLSRLVSKRSGIVVQPNKAIVGDNVSRDASGIHQNAVINHPETYHWMNTSQELELVINNQSGRAAIDKRASFMGIIVRNKEESIALRGKVKEFLHERKRSVTDTDLERMVADLRSETLKDRFVLGDVEMHESDHHSTSRVTIFVDGRPFAVEGKGNGPIDAAVRAVKNATGLDIDIADYAGRSLGEGSDAESGCTLAVQNSIKITSYAEDVSVPKAAIKAYVAALNTIDRSMQRKIQ